MRSEVTSFSILFLISKINKDSLERFVKEWSPKSKINKIIFSFYNPNVGEPNDLWIPFRERDKIIRDLQNMSVSFPKIRDSAIHLEYFLKKNQKKTISECWKTRNTFDIHLDSLGNRKLVNLAKNKGLEFTCGTPDTDCYRCGADILARSARMSDHRFKYLGKLLFSHLANLVARKSGKNN